MSNPIDAKPTWMKKLLTEQRQEQGSAEGEVSRRDLTGALLAGLGVVTLTGVAGCVEGVEDGPETVAAAAVALTSIVLVDTMAELRTVNDTSGARVAVLRGYYAPGDQGSGVFHWVVGLAADDQGTIVVPMIANGGYWKRIYEGPLNVRWFGAKGTGLVADDDGVAIQRAIDVAGLSPSGGEVFIPAGKYNVGSTSNPNGLFINFSNVTVRGTGKSSVLRKANSAASLLTVGATGATSHVIIRDLSLQMATGVSPSGWGLYCSTSAIFMMVDNLHIHGIQRGIGLEPVNSGSPTNQVHNCVIRGCIIQGVEKGISLFNCVDTFISDTGIYDIPLTAGCVGLQFESGCDGLYTSNVIVTGGNPGVLVQHSWTSSSQAPHPPRHGFFSRTASDSGATAAWRFAAGRRMLMQACWAATQIAGASGVVVDSGVGVLETRNLEFDNCIVLSCAQDGYRLNGGKNIGIVGGEALANSFQTANMFYGVVTNAVDGIRIVGLRSGSDSEFTGQQRHGIFLGGNTRNIVVQNCDLRDNVLTGIGDASPAPFAGHQKFIGNNLGA